MQQRYKVKYKIYSPPYLRQIFTFGFKQGTKINIVADKFTILPLFCNNP